MGAPLITYSCSTFGVGKQADKVSRFLEHGNLEIRLKELIADSSYPCSAKSPAGVDSL